MGRQPGEGDVTDTVTTAERGLMPGPVAATERIVPIDVLRGFALLGILVMNIQSFAMVGAAYDNPTALGDLRGANFLVWLLSHLLADQKFISIFSMLFGLLHAYLLWYGDILYTYGVCGLFVYLFRRKSPHTPYV